MAARLPSLGKSLAPSAPDAPVPAVSDDGPSKSNVHSDVPRGKRPRPPLFPILRPRCLRPRRRKTLAPGAEEMIMRHLSLRDIDWTLLLVVMLICGVGVVQIYSATLGTDSHSAWWKQILYIFGGLVLMWIVLCIDFHSLLHHVPLLYISSVVALVGTYCGGRVGFRIATLDPAPRRHSFTGIGICQAGDNIVGSPLSDRVEDGRAWRFGSH